MNQTLTKDDAAWLDRIHRTLEANEVRPSHRSGDFDRLGTLIATLKGEHTPEVGPPRATLHLPSQNVDLDSHLGGYAYYGTVEIIGVWHHVRCLRIRDNGDLIEPDDAAPDDVKAWFTDLTRLNDGALHPVALPGVTGRYVLCVFPFAD